MGRASKTAVLPGYCKIERRGCCAPLCYRFLIWIGRTHRASDAPAFDSILSTSDFDPLEISKIYNVKTLFN